MLITWIRRGDSGWHWYSHNGCGRGWYLNMWDGKAEMRTVVVEDVLELLDGPVCPECLMIARRVTDRERE